MKRNWRGRERSVRDLAGYFRYFGPRETEAEETNSNPTKYSCREAKGKKLSRAVCAAFSWIVGNELIVLLAITGWVMSLRIFCFPVQADW